MKRFLNMTTGLSVAGALGLLVAMIVSCGSPSRVPVSGMALLDGQPIPFADVFFVSLGDRDRVTSFAGATDGSGRFRLHQGAVPGEYRVLVKPSPRSSLGASVAALDTRQFTVSHKEEPAADDDLNGSVPDTYQDLMTTDLTMHVPDGGTTAAHLILLSGQAPVHIVADRSAQPL